MFKPTRFFGRRRFVKKKKKALEKVGLTGPGPDRFLTVTTRCVSLLRRYAHETVGNRTRERGAVQGVQDVGRVPVFGHGQRSAVQVVLPAHIGPGIGDGRTVRDQRPPRREQTTVVRHRRADHADQNQRRVDEDFRPSPVPLRSRQRHSAGKTPDNRFTTYSREIPNDRFGTFSREIPRNVVRRTFSQKRFTL